MKTTNKTIILNFLQYKQFHYDKKLKVCFYMNEIIQRWLYFFQGLFIFLFHVLLNNQVFILKEVKKSIVN